MKKAKLIACLSLIPAVATASIFLSSCSGTKTYTIANLANTTYVAAAANTAEAEVTLCNDIYVVDPDHQTASINISKSTCNVEGPQKDLISNCHFVKNATNNSIGVLAEVNNWNGVKLEVGSIVLKLELVLDNGTPIDCKTNIILKHDYWISPREPWIITASGNTKQFQLMEGFLPAKDTGTITWSVYNVPSGSNFSFSNNGLLTFNGSTIPHNKEITINATLTEYSIEQNIWIVDGNQ